MKCKTRKERALIEARKLIAANPIAYLPETFVTVHVSGKVYRFYQRANKKLHFGGYDEPKSMDEKGI